MAFGFGFGPRVLPMGRRQIERETKREKMDFRLGGTQEKGEQGIAAFEKTQGEWVQE